MVQMAKVDWFALAVLGLLGGTLGSPFVLTAQEPPREGLGEGIVSIRGTVVDRVNREPIVGAEVLVRSTDREASDVRITGESGAFHFAAVPPGLYDVQIRRLGYTSLDLVLDAEGGQLVSAHIELVPAALELEPIVVTSQSRDRLDWVGFRQRSATSVGHFLTRGDIEQLDVARVSQLFRGMAGFRVVPSTSGTGSTVVGRGNCQPTYYLDGILMGDMSGGQLDQVVQPEYLEGLEVYSGAQTPGQFQTGRCGTVVAWTHTPSDRVGHVFDWRRAAAAAALVLATFTLAF
jgi:hypothetical protein